jgi:hypothetical protein
MKRLVVGVVFLGAVGSASLAHAQIGVGTWARTDAAGAGLGLTMTVDTCCNGGFRLTYHLPAAPGQPPVSMIVDSPMNGTEVPALVGGKPSGQTMAIKRVDDHHYTAVMKMGGQTTATSTATLSADGRTLTIESVMGAGGAAQKETWVLK